MPVLRSAGLLPQAAVYLNVSMPLVLDHQRLLWARVCCYVPLGEQRHALLCVAELLFHAQARPLNRWRSCCWRRSRPRRKQRGCVQRSGRSAYLHSTMSLRATSVLWRLATTSWKSAKPAWLGFRSPSHRLVRNKTSSRLCIFDRSGVC